MQQFQVPQFIEIEDRIAGVITMRQFVFLVVAGFSSLLLFTVLQLWLWIIVTGIMALTIIVTAFVQYNGQPLSNHLMKILRFYLTPHLMLWKKPTESSPPIHDSVHNNHDIENTKTRHPHHTLLPTVSKTALTKLHIRIATTRSLSRGAHNV